LTARSNQKRRTRRALLDAAALLVRAGQTPTIADVAEAALVSPATVYRYFPSMRALVLEVAGREAAQRIDHVVASLPADPEQRIDALVGAIAELHLDNEVLWRGVLSASLERPGQAEALEQEHDPLEGNRQLHAVQSALAPLAESLGSRRYRQLVMATVVVSGVEAMVAARDACALERGEAREVIRWAAGALLRTAIQDCCGDSEQPTGV
jgi:AcrR family transcriptional regulator